MVKPQKNEINKDKPLKRERPFIVYCQKQFELETGREWTYDEAEEIIDEIMLRTVTLRLQEASADRFKNRK